MTVTTEAAFYDDAMTEAGSPAMLPLEQSPWLGLYAAAAGWIHLSHPVVDLGCGTGRFAELLRQGQHHGGYLGLDFSEAAIAEARHYVLKPRRMGEHPEWRAEFEVCDLREWEPDPARAGATEYVCLETLEHLEDDVDLIRRIPPGHELIFSVPNYDSAAHLRRFFNVGDAWERYGHLLEFMAWQAIGEPRKRIHIYRTARRSTAW